MFFTGLTFLLTLTFVNSLKSDFNICKFIKICFKEQSRMENI